MSPQKVRLVLDAVRGKTVAQARVQLRFLGKIAAEPVLKLINSACANATNNFGLSPDSLWVKKIVADGGPILYRYRPAAMGRSTPIRKRTTHITVILEGDAKPASKKAKSKK